MSSRISPKAPLYACIAWSALVERFVRRSKTGQVCTCRWSGDVHENDDNVRHGESTSSIIPYLPQQLTQHTGWARKAKLHISHAHTVACNLGQSSVSTRRSRHKHKCLHVHDSFIADIMCSGSFSSFTHLRRALACIALNWELGSPRSEKESPVLPRRLPVLPGPSIPFEPSLLIMVEGAIEKRYRQGFEPGTG